MNKVDDFVQRTTSAPEKKSFWMTGCSHNWHRYLLTLQSVTLCQVMIIETGQDPWLQSSYQTLQIPMVHVETKLRTNRHPLRRCVSFRGRSRCLRQTLCVICQPVTLGVSADFLLYFTDWSSWDLSFLFDSSAIIVLKTSVQKPHMPSGYKCYFKSLGLHWTDDLTIILNTS